MQKVIPMTEWVTIENIAFRGVPRDGERLNDVGAAGLIDTIAVGGDEGAARSLPQDSMSTINCVESTWLIPTPGFGSTAGCQAPTVQTLNALICR